MYCISLKHGQRHTCPSAEEFQASQAKYNGLPEEFGSSSSSPIFVLQSQRTQSNQKITLGFQISAKQEKHMN